MQAEGLINSRPLTVVSSDAGDLEPLTPLHFLVGHNRVCTSLEVDADQEERMHPRQRWKCIQQVVKTVWKRWLREIVSRLNLTTKWLGASKSVQEGDILLCLDDTQPRAKWPLCRVVETYPGTDKVVRVVDVLMNGKRYRRSVHRLVPLEVEPDQAEGSIPTTAAMELEDVV